jgi:hypothetical protein
MRVHRVIGVALVAGVALGLHATASSDGEYVMIGKDNLWSAPRPDKPDLSVQYISRQPRFPGLQPEYVKIDDALHGQGETGPVRIANAGAQHGPKPGQEVSYTAVVRNVGTQPPDQQRCLMHHGNDAHDEAIGKNTAKWDATYRCYCEQTACSFNRDVGVRRGLFGEYLFDVPSRNTFVFLSPLHERVPNARIALFVGRGRGYTGCGFNAEPNVVGVSDAAGAYLLDRNPWDHVFIWGNNGVVMSRVTPGGGAPLIGLLDIAQLNLAYWCGHPEQAQHVVLLQRAPSPASK